MFVRVTNPFQDLARDLKSQLLVSEEHPALAIAAARALAAARRGNFIEVGATVTGVELMGAIPFYANDSPDRRAVISLDDLGNIASGDLVNPPSHVLIVAELNARWIRGDGFFLDLR